ncbi:MAG: hypothetical protein OSB60_07195 [Myxococcota bacterium]|nr:hypothetical protein [Myxococcota bacterium]
MARDVAALNHSPVIPSNLFFVYLSANTKTQLVFSTHGIMTTFSVRKPGAQPSGTDRDEFGPTESSHRVEDVAGNHGPDSFFHRRRPISFTLMVV